MTSSATWIDAVPAILVGIVVLLIPGLIATAPLRLGLVARTAISAVVSVATIGAAGVLFGLARVPLAAWQPLVIAVVLGILAYVVRRRAPGLRLPRERVRWWWILLTVLGSAALIAVVAFAAVPSPDRISQTYDNVFHLAAIAHIVDTGDASSLTLRTLIETGKTWSFYPAGWHTLVALTVQLTGTSIPIAVNAAWIAVCAAVWLPGVAWLAQILLRRFESGRVALVALPLGAAFGAMPYTLLVWGTLYPTFLATALLPAAIAVPVLTGTAFRSTRHRVTALVLGAAGTLLAIAAIAFAQPRALATWALLLAPFVVGAFVRRFRRGWRRRGRARRRAVLALVLTAGAVVLVLVVGFVYAVTRLGLFDRPLDERLGGPQAQATQSVLAGLWQVVAQSWPIGGAAVTLPAALLAVAVLVGLVAGARRRTLRWAVIAYVIAAVLFAAAAGSDDIVTKLATALWYKDRYRLSSALPVLGVTFATFGILVTARLLRRTRRTPWILAGILSWAAAVTSALVLALTGVTSATASVFALPARAASSEVVSQAQIDFMRQLPTLVPAGQRILGDPWDGSGLTLLFGDREPVFPHVNGLWDADRALIALHLQDIDTDPAVCAALDRLRVRYVFYNPHEFGGGDPSGNHFAGVHTAVQDGLFTPVSTDGDSTLYRIDQCGPLP
ncbi:DUF6541 family protein [Microbacterium sp. X-17]|uniref:DUF6541 family protein n=1 Tax=Microbacterium sp. X-17 TaxID=3144404 RepID=UPI0031F551C9